MTNSNPSNDSSAKPAVDDASRKRRAISAISLGLAYGLTIRLGFETGSFYQIVSKTFLFVAPFCVGAFAVLLAAGGERISIGRQVLVSLSTMGFFLAAMFFTFLEGLICIVLIVPVFLLAAVFGGLAAGLANNYFRRPSKARLSAVAILPFLLGPIEGQLPPASSEQTVTTVIQVHASPGVVFDQLAAVKGITSDELGFSFVHLIGLPKPVEAAMTGVGTGAVRVSRWEKGVSFNEVVTLWQRPTAMHYKFVIPPGSIPREALDRHVEMGGEYFTVLDGGYDLVERDGGTELRLTTRFLNKSQLKLYGDLWGKMVLADFHRSILGLMKNRAEAAYRQSSTLAQKGSN